MYQVAYTEGVATATWPRPQPAPVQQNDDDDTVDMVLPLTHGRAAEPEPEPEPAPKFVPAAEEVRSRRRWALGRFTERNAFLRKPAFRILAMAVVFTVLFVGIWSVIEMVQNTSVPCQRAAFAGYTSECLLTAIPTRPPQPPYREITRPTWQDMQRPVLSTFYNGVRVDIEPRTLVADLRALSHEDMDRCLCGPMYGLGLSVAAIHGSVFVSPQMVTPPDQAETVAWRVPASPRLEALRFRDTTVRAPARAFVNYVTLDEDVRGKQLTGRDTACIALCLAVDEHIGMY